MKTAKVFVVSAQEIFRSGVITIVGNDPILEVVGDAPNLDCGVLSTQGTTPDLIILDLHARDLTQEFPQLLRHSSSFVTKMIAITSTSTDYELEQCLQYGVSGIVCRDATRSEMTNGIRRVLAGRTYYCSFTNAKLKKVRGALSLTKRELEVLQFLALGLPNKDIAERLAVGIGTIKTHLININSKLNVASRTEAVIRGVQQRLISI